MKHRKLHNYELYRMKIDLYAKANRVKIKYSETCCSDAAYTPTLRLITLEEDMPESREIAVLLHELGHVIDDDARLSLSIDKALDLAIKACNSDAGATLKQFALVMNCEREAWKQGRIIAKKKLMIHLGKWFEKERKSALQSYRLNTKIKGRG